MQEWARKQIEAALQEPVKGQGRINSSKIQFDGFQFDSKKELAIYREAKFDPAIVILEVHPTFELFSGFQRGTRKIKPIKYTADLKVLNTREDREEIWEVKSKGSRAMADYGIRKKLFLMKYPNIVFREITFDRSKRTVQVFLP